MKDDDIWTRDEIASPCVQICVIHPQARLCTGCMRTGDEISRWSRMTADERARIMVELPGRTGQLMRRRGGRAARLKR